ncbi:hypothetical protein BU16DRAFT_564020 [Lophium mytilinum]|uniref:Uncharacterized protein n=1 Tax=Lophium mytilinum TaxID=390894 RepID=A0A6A6QKT5_9PEZI|nr:hypothetical protein BU16DRAFT_564020 [Lophium mytilinum]
MSTISPKLMPRKPVSQKLSTPKDIIHSVTEISPDAKPRRTFSKLASKAQRSASKAFHLSNPNGASPSAVKKQSPSSSFRRTNDSPPRIDGPILTDMPILLSSRDITPVTIVRHRAEGTTTPDPEPKTPEHLPIYEQFKKSNWTLEEYSDYGSPDTVHGLVRALPELPVEAVDDERASLRSKSTGQASKMTGGDVELPDVVDEEAVLQPVISEEESEEEYYRIKREELDLLIADIGKEKAEMEKCREEVEKSKKRAAAELENVLEL